MILTTTAMRFRSPSRDSCIRYWPSDRLCISVARVYTAPGGQSPVSRPFKGRVGWLRLPRELRAIRTLRSTAHPRLPVPAPLTSDPAPLQGLRLGLGDARGLQMMLRRMFSPRRGSLIGGARVVHPRCQRTTRTSLAENADGSHNALRKIEME